ncbi:hypothetical protein [Umezawaea sp. Da 62-37]|uniref:hypothetical protein n=1 Tax=Umezawaea sp. Da 62-37 TaxID=3075927 RepID=UPI0028F6E87D|nr:hypothetical protein [Umezawaea sp. Da 62-37]WNV85387.1 hypothetical protein RM788_45930 [Umezawaea sp. Da 62-37]
MGFGSSSVSAATAAMSAASTKASPPPALGAVITPSMTGRWSSAKFCITHDVRRTDCVMP